MLSPNFKTKNPRLKFGLPEARASYALIAWIDARISSPAPASRMLSWQHNDK